MNYLVFVIFDLVLFYSHHGHNPLQNFHDKHPALTEWHTLYILAAIICIARRKKKKNQSAKFLWSASRKSNKDRDTHTQYTNHSAMLSIILEQYDYKALTKSYMDIFNSKKFAQFLNTTQTGYAHSSSGIEFSVFMKTIFTSLCFCTIQLTLFCLLRSVFNYLYQPRCFCVPIGERMEVLPRGFSNGLFLLWNVVSILIYH